MIYLLITTTHFDSSNARVDIEGALCDAEKNIILVNDNRGILLQGTIHVTTDPKVGEFINLDNLGLMHDFRYKGETSRTFDDL